MKPLDASFAAAAAGRPTPPTEFAVRRPGGAPKPELSPEVERGIRKRVAHFARQLVADALFAPILADARETNHGSGPFATTAAEKRLGPLIDQQIADSMTRGSKLAIVASVERSALRAAGLEPLKRPALAPAGGAGQGTADRRGVLA
jgi:hypothetical protein